eukprot:361095-Chlamydomonas_euryale.AAC.7
MEPAELADAASPLTSSLRCSLAGNRCSSARAPRSTILLLGNAPPPCTAGTQGKCAAQPPPFSPSVPVGFKAGMAKLQSQGGADALLGWSVLTEAGHELVGEVIEVVPSAAPARGVMLKARRLSELQPYGYSGTEEHYVPLRDPFVWCLYPDQKVLTVKLPKGEGGQALCRLGGRVLQAHAAVSQLLLSNQLRRAPAWMTHRL